MTTEAAGRIHSLRSALSTGSNASAKRDHTAIDTTHIPYSLYSFIQR